MLTVHASTLKQSFIVAFYIRTSKQVLRGYFEAVICWWKSDQKLVIFTPDYYYTFQLNFPQSDEKYDKGAVVEILTVFGTL